MHSTIIVTCDGEDYDTGQTTWADARIAILKRFGLLSSFADGSSIQIATPFARVRIDTWNGEHGGPDVIRSFHRTLLDAINDPGRTSLGKIGDHVEDVRTSHLRAINDPPTGTRWIARPWSKDKKAGVEL